eukprot:2948299-Amphidinium_carterae.2
MRSVTRSCTSERPPTGCRRPSQCHRSSVLLYVFLVNKWRVSHNHFVDQNAWHHMQNSASTGTFFFLDQLHRFL